MIPIKQGLDLPIHGAPAQNISVAAGASRVALLGGDYVGMRPAMEVAVGDRVRRGSRLLTDRKNEGVVFTAPAGGHVIEINRGPKRVFESLVIEVEDEPAESFTGVTENELDTLTSLTARELLVQSGLWTSLRQRPFSTIPNPTSEPAAVFITAMDTQPHAPDPEIVLAGQEADFVLGTRLLVRAVCATVYLVTRPESGIPGTDLPGVVHETFSGPHPAGLPGTHMHFLRPVSERRVCWHIGYQDVVAIGKLVRTGEVDTSRVVALCGPSCVSPRLVRTTWGACVEELTVGESNEVSHRVISGSVLSGRLAVGPEAFLGRYHLQVSMLPEAVEREWLGWQRPGGDRFSVTRAFAGSARCAIEKWLGWSTPTSRYRFNTSLNGSDRAMVPIGSYERVMPLDVLATYLLRALAVGDTETARALGALELDEEDLALCTYVCPGKYDFGRLLREALEEIRHEG